MGTSQAPLRKVAGLRFFKLLGSGADNGFGLRPNLDLYGMMAVWESAAAAEAFFAAHPLWADYQRRSREIWTVRLAPIKAHGLWDGRIRLITP